MKLFGIMTICLGKDVRFNMFWRPFCTTEWMILAILVKGHMRNISVKLFQKSGH